MKEKFVGEKQRYLRQTMFAGVLVAGVAGCSADPTLSAIDKSGFAGMNLRTGQAITPDLTEQDIENARILATKLNTPLEECTVVYIDDGVDTAGGIRTKGTNLLCGEPSTGLLNQITREDASKPGEGVVVLDDFKREVLLSVGGNGGEGTLQSTLRGIGPPAVIGGALMGAAALHRPSKTNIENSQGQQMQQQQGQSSEYSGNDNVIFRPPGHHRRW